jgi:hypothetical protein
LVGTFFTRLRAPGTAAARAMPSPIVIRHAPRGFWGVKNHPLSGITLAAWARLLWRHRFDVDWLRYWPRLAFLTLMSCFNLVGAACDWLLYSRAIARQELNPEPVFILGHPRTGTTHLHNLLSKDPRFAHCTTFTVGFPSGFLSFRFLAPLLGLIMDSKRPMDDMALAWDTPQEDEVAVNQLSAGASPYMPLCFPRRERDFRRFYDFRDASPAEFARWRDAFVHFLKKTQYAAGGAGKRLLLKSPVHTARVRTLRAMFPRAQFIFAHRHPLETFQSAEHMAHAYYHQCHLQTPSAEDTQEFILRQGEILHAAYRGDIGAVDAKDKTQVRFEDLNADPLGVLRRVYGELGWSGGEARGGGSGAAFFEGTMRPTLEAYRDSLRHFRMNAHAPLSAEAERIVRARWGAWFEDLGYE